MILPDEVSPSLVFGIADLHDGPRVDLPSLFSHLQQETVIMGLKGERSPYPYVQKMKGVRVHLPLSEALKTHESHSHKYTDSDISENRQFYQSGVNFINILQAAFKRADTKSVKKTV